MEVRSVGWDNRIESLDADGFTLGDAVQVNDTGPTYYYFSMNRCRKQPALDKILFSTTEVNPR